MENLGKREAKGVVQWLACEPNGRRRTSRLLRRTPTWSDKFPAHVNAVRIYRFAAIFIYGIFQVKSEAQNFKIAQNLFTLSIL